MWNKRVISSLFMVIALLMTVGLTHAAEPEPEPVADVVPAFSAWTLQVGSWEATNTSIMHTTKKGTNTNAYAALAQDGVKHIYEWTIEFGTNDGSTILNGGLHVLSSDATAINRQTGYMIWQDANKIDVYRVTNNGLKTIRSFKEGWKLDATQTPVKCTYRLVVDVAAQLLTLYRDNVLVGEIPDPDVYTSGAYISVRTNTVISKFSDIKYASVAAK